TQMSRYEFYRRTTVNKGGVKKIANTVLNQSVSNSVAIVLSGVSKVFVGEIVEKARSFELKKMDLKNVDENGPLLPEHIREAWRLYQIESG
ncbi:hypothetical protein WICANDRAFT_22985, partial [Wickerhamomyces anomalus NRRL Y-366-8]